MRPGDFSPGNTVTFDDGETYAGCFNEAGGFLPRKQSTPITKKTLVTLCFNEAGGFLPRKPSFSVLDTAICQLQ